MFCATHRPGLKFLFACKASLGRLYKIHVHMHVHVHVKFETEEEQIGILAQALRSNACIPLCWS